MTPAHRLSIACLAVLSSAWAQAQPARLADLMELAVQKHPTVLQARSQAQAAGFELEAAEWGRYPSVTSDIRSDSSATQSVLKVEQPLWAGGRIEARIALSQAGVRVAQSAVLEAQATALVQTSGSYLEILRLSDRDRIAADNLEALQRLVDLMSRRTQAQISASVDLTLAQARLQQATSERLQIQRQLESTRTALTEWVGPIPARLAQTRAIDHPTLRDTAGRCGQLFDQALEFSAQRKRLLAQMDTANAQIELTKAQNLPAVVAGYQHILAGPLAAGADRGRAYIGLQFQSGSGLSARSVVQSSIAKREASEQELQVFERQLQSQVNVLCSDIEALQAQLGPALALEKDADELVASYLRQYQIGRKNWLDVLNAQREKTQAMFSVADVRYALLQSQARLLILTGVLPTQSSSVIHE